MHSTSKQLALKPSIALHILVFFVACCSAAKGPYPSNGGNPASSSKLSRSKRVAIFDGSGTNKIVAGLAFPIKQEDTVQSVWGFINYQAQYVPSPVPIFWWTYWNTSTFVSTAREWQKDMKGYLRHDETRLWVYDLIETGLEQLVGHHGGVCLLKSICEISQRPFEPSNIFSEILNAILVPPFDNVPAKYLYARDAGRAGADCWKTYKDCSTKLWTKIPHIPNISF
ncbi:hypothetical protein KR009_012332 [Drosophila setifemur]|nr:hypothetical protein KR009_012332 [Drosophila setifemur]